MIAATDARRCTIAAAQMRIKVEQEMAAWEAAQAAQAAYDDDAELEAAAGSRPAHTRTVRLSPWAARLWRTRPMVKARTYDGKPLIEHHVIDRQGLVDHVAKDEERRAKRLRADGATPPPARAAAVAGDDARRTSTASGMARRIDTSMASGRRCRAMRIAFVFRAMKPEYAREYSVRWPYRASACTL